MFNASKVWRSVSRSSLRRAATSLRRGTLPARAFGTAASDNVSFTFFEGGEEVPVTAAVGKTLLEVAHENEVELEGACDGALACSTCHLILEKATFDKLAAPVEEELDMLDLAFGLTDTSRLGCQIKVTNALKGARFIVPGDTNDMRPP